MMQSVAASINLGDLRNDDCCPTMSGHGVGSSPSVLRALRGALHRVPDSILYLLVQFASETCYHCKIPQYPQSEDLGLEWTPFRDGVVCSDCCLTECLCVSCEKLSDSALGFAYCDRCGSPLCMDCVHQSFCIFDGPDVLCPYCLD